MMMILLFFSFHGPYDVYERKKKWKRRRRKGWRSRRRWHDKSARRCTHCLARPAQAAAMI